METSMNVLNIRMLNVALGGGLLLAVATPNKPAAATDLTGLAEFSICNDSTVCSAGDFGQNSLAGSGSLWDTQGGNQSYNLYIAPGDVSGVTSDSQFINYGNSIGTTAIDVALPVGTYTYSMFGDNHPSYTPDGLNLFFDGTNGIPGISVFAPLKTGPTEPAFASNCSGSTPALANGLLLVPGACSLSFFDGTNTVTLTDYFWQRSDTTGKSIDLVDTFNDTPNRKVDFVGEFTVVVTAGSTAQGGITAIPEPASFGLLGAALVGLWGARRRSNG
jgi:hypothetical protein